LERKSRHRLSSQPSMTLSRLGHSRHRRRSSCPPISTSRLAPISARGYAQLRRWPVTCWRTLPAQRRSGPRQLARVARAHNSQLLARSPTNWSQANDAGTEFAPTCTADGGLAAVNCCADEVAGVLAYEYTFESRRPFYMYGSESSKSTLCRGRHHAQKGRGVGQGGAGIAALQQFSPSHVTRAPSRM
jgi:hypothetical protein